MRHIPTTSTFSLTAVSALVLTAVAAPAAFAQSSYFALGDSYAFGYTTPSGTGTGNGAPTGGYYAPVAAALAANTGSSVVTTNLAIPGETTYSFFGATDPFLPVPVTHSIADNTNYTTQTTQSAELTSLTSTVSQKPSFVTLQIGGNDIIQYLYESLYLPGGSYALASANLSNAVAASIANYSTILTQVKADSAPNAKIFVVDYADPFAALSATQNPTALGLQGLDVTATNLFDSALQSLAQSSGVGFVDIASAFSTSNPAAGNYIGNFFSINDPTANTSLDGAAIPDFHPNAAGYSVIASKIENSAFAPEPDTAALLLALAGVGALLRRTRGKRIQSPR